MNSTADHVLHQLGLEELREDGVEWQQRKSARTRVSILEAAIDCLRTLGYAHTTIQDVMETAGLTRGGINHHYSTKQKVITSAAAYIVFKRMEIYTSRIRAIASAESGMETEIIDIYWESLHTREFGAYLELLMASRTDPELAEIFLPLARRFHLVEVAELIQACPKWGSKTLTYSRALDYCIVCMQGMFINKGVWENDGRCRELRRFLACTVVSLFESD